MKKSINALFVGMYPNNVSPYRNVFFQNLIFAMADMGVDCTVISPIPVTKYRLSIKSIAYKTIHKTPNGSEITVYYPWYVSASSKQIGTFNTEKLSEKWFEDSIMKTVKKINKKFDFVYGHFFLYGGLAAVRVGKYLKIPSFIAYGECDFETQVRQTYGYPKPDQLEGLTGIISVSSKNTKELNDLGIVKGVPIITAPNSTDLKLFFKKDKEECRRKLGLPQDKYIVGFVGGFIERKGDKRLLEAINHIEGVYGAFAGKGDNPPSGEKVVFCKAIEHNAVSDFLNAIDVFCLPTLSEGSCNAIVEAMACGCPIISSNRPFNDDALDDSNSIRIDPLSIQEIKESIEVLMNSPQMCESFSIKSLEKAKEFEIGQRANKILSFIKKCGQLELE